MRSSVSSHVSDVSTLRVTLRVPYVEPLIVRSAISHVLPDATALRPTHTLPAVSSVAAMRSVRSVVRVAPVGCIASIDSPYRRRQIVPTCRDIARIDSVLLWVLARNEPSEDRGGFHGSITPSPE